MKKLLLLAVIVLINQSAFARTHSSTNKQINFHLFESLNDDKKKKNRRTRYKITCSHEGKSEKNKNCIDSLFKKNVDTSITKQYQSCKVKYQPCKVKCESPKEDPNVVRVIKINFNDKSIFDLTSLNNLKNGDLYQVQIDSINLNKYDVNITKKDTTITSNVEFPLFKTIGLGEINDILKLFSSSSKSIESLILNLKQKIEDNKAFTDEEQARLFLANQLQNLQSSSELLIAELKDNSNLINDSIIYEMDIYDLKYLASSSTLQTIGVSYSYKTPNEIIKYAETLRKELHKLKNRHKDIKAKYQALKSSPEWTKHVKNEEVKKSDSLFNKAFTMIEPLIDNALNSISSKVVSDFITKIIFLEENNKKSYTSLPFQLTEDQTSLNITITPKKPEYGSTYSTELVFPYYKNWYIGAGMSFYYGNFKNTTYSTQGIQINDSTTLYAVKDENLKRGEFGLAAQIFLGYNFNRIISANLTFGPALSLSNPVKPRLLFGGGLAFGDKNKVTIGLLGIAGSTSRLSTVYSENATYVAEPSNITINEFALSWGLSIGYIYKF